MGSNMAVVDCAPIALRTPEAIKDALAAILSLTQKVMVKERHYGTIPGADKPTLYKAGAELIATMFQFAVEPDVEDLSTPEILRYRVRVRLVNKHTGILEGAGIGEASTGEEKYAWRGAISPKEYEQTQETQKRVKFGRKWDKARRGYSYYEVQQIRTNPYDLANTILKMAKKRAFIDAILQTTACSDIFSQDIEDLPEYMVEQMGQGTEAEGNEGGDLKRPQPKEEKKDVDLTATINDGQIKALHDLLDKAGVLPENREKYCAFQLEVEADKFAFQNLTVAEAQKLFSIIKAKEATNGKAKA